jgi:hypothetical protein
MLQNNLIIRNYECICFFTGQNISEILSKIKHKKVVIFDQMACLHRCFPGTRVTKEPDFTDYILLIFNELYGVILRIPRSSGSNSNQLRTHISILSDAVSALPMQFVKLESIYLYLHNSDLLPDLIR